jgi:Spy/CpxP family protein refolding chaperone
MSRPVLALPSALTLYATSMVLQDMMSTELESSKSPITTRKGKRAMKTVYSVALMVAVVFLLALNTPVTAFSQMMEMDKMDEMMGMCIEHAEKIGLTDDQIMKMKTRHSDMQKKHARFKADEKIAKIELMDIMDVKDFDLEKANSAVKKIAEIKTTHHLEMLKAMKEMRKMLTDEQFKAMKKMMTMKMGEKGPAKMKMDKP